VRLPPSIPLCQAALLGCGVVTGIGAVDRAQLRVGAGVCVIGCGGVGQHVIAGARLSGAGLIVAVDADEAKLALALRRGATHAVLASGGDVVERVRAIADGGVDHAFEVVGSPATIREAWDVLRPGGSAIVVGLTPGGVEVSLPAIEFLAEKTISGCYYGSTDVHAALGRLAELVVDGRLELAEVVSDVIALDEVEAALGRLRRGQGARSVIVIDSELAGVER